MSKAKRTSGGNRCEGAVLVMVVLFTAVLMGLTLVSVDMTRSHTISETGMREHFEARSIADSGAAQAMSRIKEGGVTAPLSGTGAEPAWVPFDNGEYLYHSEWDDTTEATTVRAWGRIPVEATVSGSPVAPDHVDWDGTGYMVQGIEVIVQDTRYFPESPTYFGNGGIEKPEGGFSWGAGVDPADPGTWIPVTSPSSYQAASIPFQVSALDHPADFLYNGGAPEPANGLHPFKPWVSQNPIGQYNVDAWFHNSAGTGNDPTTNVFPPPTADYYVVDDPTSPDHPYAVDHNVADVQTYAWELWSKHSDDPNAVLLNQGSHSGIYGDMDDPQVTFVTGSLTVNEGESFKGAGILVIRDDYDPNVDSNNTPSTRAGLTINGTFEWTGLVLVAGWAPTIQSGANSDTYIVGSLYGEDSVQSGGEISLDSATIIMRVNGPFRLLYSSTLFKPGGIVYDHMPGVKKSVIGVRAL